MAVRQEERGGQKNKKNCKERRKYIKDERRDKTMRKYIRDGGEDKKRYRGKQESCSEPQEHDTRN